MQLGYGVEKWKYELKEKCMMLNADEYVTVADKSGHKDTIKGPCAYMPEAYGVVCIR